MYVKIGLTEYHEIKNLSFGPQVDIAGLTVPIDEFYVDIITDQYITAGQFIKLYDDRDNLWAEYWAIFAERIDTMTVRVKAQSVVSVFDRVKLPAVYYSSYNAGQIIRETVIALGSFFPSGTTIGIDPNLDGLDASGFYPEQTARERIQWMLFVTGGFVKSFYGGGSGNVLYFTLIDELTETDIPIEKTYWKPSVSYNDYVTAVNVTAYTLTQGTPANTDQWVKDANDVTYIVTPQVFTVTNPDVPANVPANEVNITGVYVVNDTNVSDILTRLGGLYFNRTVITADVINNHEYFPADKVSLQTDSENIVKGHISSCTFTFGLQAKSRIKLIAVEEVASGNLIIRYMYNNVLIGERTYRLPVGNTYQIENPYIDINSSSHRYVYRPLNQYAEGTIAAGDNINVQQCDVALHFYYSDNTLLIISVSGVEASEPDAETGEVVVIIE